MNTADASVARLLPRLVRHVSKRRRVQFCGLLLMMLASAAVEMLSIGAVIPFIALLSNPQTLLEFPWLQAHFSRLGWETPESIVPAMTLTFMALILIAGFVRFLVLFLTNRLIYALGFDISVTLFRRILVQPYEFHIASSSAEIISGVNKVYAVLNGIVRPVLDISIATVLSLAILGVLVYIQPVATFMAMVFFIAGYVLIAIKVRRRLAENSRQTASAQTRRVRCIQEGLGGIRDTILDNRQERITGIFATIDRQLREAQASNAVLNQVPHTLFQTLGIVLIIGFAWFLSTRAGSLVEALPMLGALALGAQRLLPMFQKFYGAWSRMTGNQQLAADVLRLLELPAPAVSVASDSSPAAFNKQIELANISFSYAGSDERVLQNVNLVIPMGARIGIAGPTGAGKSTLADLIMGLLQPSEGQLLVDGHEINDSNRHQWHCQISHVPQDIFLLDASITENIAFGVPAGKIDMDRVRYAARCAQIEEFINSRPQGFDGIIGERGIRLSGGQRQRIGLARAIYRDASLVVLDEATSALDTTTEAAAMGAVAELDKKLTIIIIAHRHQTLAQCDQIICLEAGQITGAKVWSELVANQ